MIKIKFIFIKELFQAPNGRYSMRRFLAFISILAMTAVDVVGVVLNRPSGLVLAAGGTLGVVAVVMLFFTTWADIKSIINAIRQNKNTEGTNGTQDQT